MAGGPRRGLAGRWVVAAIVAIIGVAVAAAAWVAFGPNSTYQRQHKN
jgi:hypothetical protein